MLAKHLGHHVLLTSSKAQAQSFIEVSLQWILFILCVFNFFLNLRRSLNGYFL